eukprot:CAMPEP_0172491778 /NCGR_PEP_ID=MMETSP1066-20121228/22644_1 /TAXON_ID=671091 /ORGANISM="Coscinodiscus wailesii, Strain CCMP2513" /LENGTH=72 /DNA_ID=CAMNT_0013260983 /DNA_START=7 /DNA_END=225 /DNA_ORIENTATION=+
MTMMQEEHGGTARDKVRGADFFPPSAMPGVDRSEVLLVFLLVNICHGKGWTCTYSNGDGASLEEEADRTTAM